MTILLDSGIKKPGVPTLSCVIKDKLGFDISIRGYQDGDYPRLMSMYDHFEPKGIALGTPPPDDEIRRRWLNDIVKAFLNIIAIYQKKIIGHAAIDIFRTKVSSEYSVFLHQDFRNRGIGTKLTLIVKKICKELGCTQMWVTVSCHNTQAINVFKKVGFKFKGDIGPEREMVLDLRPKRKK